MFSSAEIYSKHHRPKAVRNHAEPMLFPEMLDPDLRANMYFHIFHHFRFFKAGIFGLSLLGWWMVPIFYDVNVISKLIFDCKMGFGKIMEVCQYGNMIIWNYGNGTI